WQEGSLLQYHLESTSCGQVLPRSYRHWIGLHFLS
ncbi:hypothetical protein D047_3239B, partial [Vibrio parahaemolyticus VPTS-2010_2]